MRDYVAIVHLFAHTGVLFRKKEFCGLEKLKNLFCVKRETSDFLVNGRLRIIGTCGN